MKPLITTNLIEWYYDYSGDQFGYLLVDSDDSQLLQRLKVDLRGASIQCLKHAASFHPASNNKQYATYLAVAKSKGGRPNLSELRKIIQTNFPNLHYDASALEVREYFNHLLERISRHDAEEKRLQERIESLLTSANTLREAYVKARQDYEQKKQDLLTETSSSDSFEQEIEAEYQRHKESEKRIEDLYQIERRTIEREFAMQVSDLSRQLGIERSNCERLEEELLRAKETASHAQSITGKRAGMSEDLIELVARTLLPGLELSKDSFRYISNEVRDPRSALEYLHKLHAKEDVPMKRFESASDGWMEIDHQISDGVSSQVRIYFRSCKAGKMKVHLADKRYQKLTAKFLNGL